MSDPRFTYHKPTEQAVILHDEFRSEIERLVTTMEKWLPECSERSFAVTKLEEAMFWGNAAIAREISAKAKTDE